MLEKDSMTAIAEKLGALGGPGKLAERDWRIRCRLNWHHKSKSAVRHLLYGERRPSIEEARQIEAAHLRMCAEKIEANREENRNLFSATRSALAAMEEGDAEFYGPQIEALRHALLRNWDVGGEGRPAVGEVK